MTSFLYLLGFVAQGCFGARSLVQWIQSERDGKVVSPTLFWVFSLIGSTLFLIYGLLRSDVVIIVGQVLSYYIYARNLYLKKVLQRQHRLVQGVLLVIPVLIVAISFAQRIDFTFLSAKSLTEPFLLIGAVGQLSLNLRYLYQWYFSELARESILPLGFWVISALGSLLVIVYGYFRSDPVLFISQSLGMIVYIRNIILHLRRNPVTEKSQVA
jgi:lipid-A-disaccharide synthase-like uncharacterized protein